ncbi:MAG: PhzF family phenazine biosynthesis protein [Chloroflexi bacterium]|nr:PhzF family phenazine biosynthesis protein [Chloroflexota bacterium]
MSHRATIRHVDAFTSTPLEGNPAAVVDGEGIDSATMQRIALNQHLSETVFLLPAESPDNHARLRIFTPGAELPFAGHPTIAASHILITEARVSLGEGEALRLETGAGLIPVDVAGDPPVYTMTQAPPEFRPYNVPLDEIAAWVGLAAGEIVRAEEVSTGLGWTLAQVASLEVMMRVVPDMQALSRVQHGMALFCLGASEPDVQVHARAWVLGAGVFEDPVTGSANGCIAAFIAKHGLMEPRDGQISYVAEQGAEIGQPGRVYARATGVPDDIRAHVGGHAVTVLRGELLL